MDTRRYRYRFIERDFMKERMKKSSEFLSEEDIEKILDEHSWRDLTFIFEKRRDYIKTYIIDNQTQCDVLLEDLNLSAKHFYHSQKRELERKDVADYIKTMIKNSKRIAN